MDDILSDKIVVKSNTKLLIDVRQFVLKMAQMSSLPSSEVNKIVLAVDEAVSNIIEHAYQSENEGNIEIEVSSDENQFTVYVRDFGKTFDPNSIKSVDINQHVKDGRKTGLGIFLMRQIMDEVKYQFRDGFQNELILIKYIKS